MSAQWIPLTPKINYLKFTVSPLSAEVALIEGQEHLWLFDVGASAEVLECLQALPKQPNVVISHFHPDHIGNLDKLTFNELYLGGFTFQKAGAGTVVKEPFFLDDGIKLKLFPLPSSHARGSLGLEVNETYAFLGDAVYSTMKQGRPAYNATLLKDEIDTLKALKAPYFLLSHAEPFLQKKEDVLTMLEGIYAQRDPNCPDIFPR